MAHFLSSEWNVEMEDGGAGGIPEDEHTPDIPDDEDRAAMKQCETRYE